MSRTNTFGATNEYSVTYPDERVFAFSPYKCVVTGTAVSQAVVFTFNGKTLTRYTGSDKKVTISLTKLFQSFFVGVEIGIVDMTIIESYKNAASKLIALNKIINVAIGVDDFDMTFDILFGALQQGEAEESEETIYFFKNSDNSLLPITLTTFIGNSIGTDVILSSYLTDNPSVRQYGFLLGETLIFTYNLIEMSVCPESYYLRWIDRKTSSYKYYNFLLGRNTKAASNGATFNYNVLELSATSGLYKNTMQTIEKISTETITVVEPSADLLQQTHIQTIFDSPKVWLYMGNSEWMEVNTSESSFEKIRNDGKKEIQVNIILPQKYNIRL